MNIGNLIRPSIRFTDQQVLLSVLGMMLDIPARSRHYYIRPAIIFPRASGIARFYIFPYIYARACVEQIIYRERVPSLFLLPGDIFRLAGEVSWGKSWRTSERGRSTLCSRFCAIAPESPKIAAWNRHIKTASRIRDPVVTLSWSRIRMSDGCEELTRCREVVSWFSAGESLLASNEYFRVT